MASGFVAPQLKLAICAILVLPFLITTATAADILLDWHVSTDFNLKHVSNDQPVGIMNTFHLFIFLFVLLMHSSILLLLVYFAGNNNQWHVPGTPYKCNNKRCYLCQCFQSFG